MSTESRFCWLFSNQNILFQLIIYSMSHAARVSCHSHVHHHVTRHNVPNWSSQTTNVDTFKSNVGRMTEMCPDILTAVK